MCKPDEKKEQEITRQRVEKIVSRRWTEYNVKRSSGKKSIFHSNKWFQKLGNGKAGGERRVEEDELNNI